MKTKRVLLQAAALVMQWPAVSTRSSSMSVPEQKAGVRSSRKRSEVQRLYAERSVDALKVTLLGLVALKSDGFISATVDC
ncbi:hypothetical protein [Corallococcus sp. bb12-1]|uniref:hypothetical protein n=1 Tax=Corallococcus sp. bb12-1 TaxID=2996784 RepID=UPI002D1E3D10|nr:hypothetical protein [Corallococcus sp. bb12-1]